MEWNTILVVQLISLFVCPIWVYYWLNQPSARKRALNDEAHYTVPDWNFVLKRWWAKQCIIRKNEEENRKSKRKAKEMVAGRIKELPTELEDLRVLKNEDSSDSLLFYGADQQGNYLLIKLTRRRHRTVELCLQLNLSDGRTYQLPNHPDTVISNNVSRGWTAAGLKIVPLESWRRWRITFNGLLRNKIQRSYHQDAGSIEHVRFNFIYIAGSKPLLWPEDWSAGLKADALAREPWKHPQWINMIKMDDSGGYDQWGSMIGQVTFEDSSNAELFLRGLRQRRWGKYKSAHFHRTASFFGVMHDGTMYCLGAHSSKGGLTHVQFGHIRKADETLHSIDWMDFNLIDFAEKRENIPTRFSINFKAGGKTYNTTIFRIMDTGSSLHGGRPWDWEGRILNLRTELNNKPGFGLGQLWYTYNGSCPLKAVPRVRHLLQPDVKPEPNVFTVPFSDRMCQSEAVVGGKGSSLALLTSVESSEFIVPQGFCVTVSALNLQIEMITELSEAVTHLEDVCTGKKSGNVEEASKRTVSLFENTPVLKTVKDMILKAVDDLESCELATLDASNEAVRYAIRSSAVGEDSEDTSAAGQNSTFLGVKGSENVVEAVAKCWASLYTHQSVEYRRQHGQPIRSGMGVCVQIMVHADAAGVMFTRHPTTGDPRQILITANYGLGESVVSAMVEPDTIVIHRSWDNTLTMKESTLGNKSLKISMSLDGGTSAESLNESENKKLCISEEVALRLGKLGLDLEALFGGARDVEWAVAKGRVFLLQARPVTALDAWTEFELTHELDSGVPSDIDVASFANVGEVLPGALSPLTLSTIVRILNDSVEFGSLKEPANPYYDRCINNAMMRCSLNFLNVMLLKVEDRITVTNKVVDIAVCGHTVTTPEMHATAKERNGTQGFMTKMCTLFDMIKDAWNNSNIEQDARILHENFGLDLEGFTKAEDLYKSITDRMNYFYQITLYHGHTSKVSVFYQVFAMSILTEGNEEFTGEHYSDLGLLLSSCNDVVSAEVPAALHEITRSIKESGRSEEFTKLEPTQAKDWLNLNCKPAAIQLDNFLKQHGHRSIKEFELMTETWDLNPNGLIAILQATVASPGNTPPKKGLRAEEIVSKLKTPRKAATKWILNKVLPLCQSSVARREVTKALLISIEHKFRLAYRKLGRLMVEECRLPDSNLLFFLTQQEIGLLLQSRNPMLVQKAVRRRRLHPRLEKLQFKEVNQGLIKPIQSEPDVQAREGAIRVCGTPVCQGSVIGRACVITNFADVEQLRPGDILVTHATDIGWSPYFPMLGGVVTELGGLISHGAVVAREYGLPCIVGAEGATRTFRTGDSVLLAGTTGVLQAI